VKDFLSPSESLRSLNTQSAAALISAATDIALVIDPSGLIRDLSFQNDDLALELEGYVKWLGQPWSSTVMVDSRNKVESLRRESSSKSATAWRHVNYASASGASIPILFSAVQIKDKGNIVALGRDMRQVTALQQRLMDAQQAMERDYARLRQAETRYRLLFEISSEAVLVADATTGKIVEANPAACQLLGEVNSFMLGRIFFDLFDVDSSGGVRSMLAGVRAAGSIDNIVGALSAGGPSVRVTASIFRQDNQSFFLVRLTAESAGEGQLLANDPQRQLITMVQHAPDGIVITSSDGNILSTNSAFLDMAQLATGTQAKAEPLQRWLGRAGTEMDVVFANLRQHGTIRLFSTALRGQFGSASEVEVSATRFLEGGQMLFGFSIRNIDRRLVNDESGGRQLPRSVAQLTELVGRVPLKDLVRETADVIERLCIEAALEMTGDNRASAASMLGLSRQSLYVKLRRFGLDQLGRDEDGE
jgi:transcriptional regulator PpsR